MSDPVLRAFRAREYPNLDATFLDSASFGLLPAVTVAAVTSLTRRRSQPRGIPALEPGALLRRARAAAAALIEGQPEDVTLAPNTSFGINLAVGLVAAGPAGRVAVSAGEFPANVLPWLTLEHRGFEVDVVPLREGLPDEDALRSAAARDDVRAVAVSAVQFATGYRADLAALGRVCRDADTLLVVDAIQALGTAPLAPADLGIDVLATGGQKWLCSPWGSGFTWIAPRHRARFLPPMVSWLAVAGGGAFSTVGGYRLDFLDDGRRFELATLGIQDYLGMAVSIEALMALGLPRIRAHLHTLHEPILDWVGSRTDVAAVTPLEPERRGGILALSVPEPHGVQRALDEAGIVASVREGHLRLAPHVYVERSEMERVARVLDEVVGRV